MLKAESYWSVPKLPDCLLNLLREEEILTEFTVLYTKIPFRFVCDLPLTKKKPFKNLVEDLSTSVGIVQRAF